MVILNIATHAISECPQSDALSTGIAGRCNAFYSAFMYTDIGVRGIGFNHSPDQDLPDEKECRERGER
jgi:hypothetical protein